MRHSADSGAVDPGRRDFLIRCYQGGAAALIPAGLTGLGWPLLRAPDSTDKEQASGEFYLHPHYRTPRPLDALLLKTQAGLDDFVTEKYADEIAAILAQWSSGLLQSSQDVGGIEKVLLPNFSGSSLRPAESRVVRLGPPIEVRHNTFKRETVISRSSFLDELRSALIGFSKVLTAEFQVTSIDVVSTPATVSPAQWLTRIRYELVATGRDFYREQRVGYWQVAWERSASGELSVRNWRDLD